MGNISKTLHFLKRNGIVKTGYAVAERLLDSKDVPYVCRQLSEEVLENQRHFSEAAPYMFSILVPTYETKPEYLGAMIESVLNQTYGRFELIIADASNTSSVREKVSEYRDSRIVYLKLESNNGISENTNAALSNAKGDYCVLLDHDDLITEDALFENASRILCETAKGHSCDMLYSDEDKCDAKGSTFYEPHKKTDLNFDLLLSNNYICHLTVINTELLKSLKFRKEYDGAQDYDVILRCVDKLRRKNGIVHISKVLYHWRCHELSTASNPQSKEYAYVAGKEALQDFIHTYDANAVVMDLPNQGFYRVNYSKNIFQIRPDIGAVGGYLYKKNKITGGIYTKNGRCPYQGLFKHFGGPFHRAILTQDAYALDIRNIIPRNEFKEYHKELLHRMTPANINDLNMEFASKLRKEGYLMLLDPDFDRKRHDRKLW